MSWKTCGNCSVKYCPWDVKEEPCNVWEPIHCPLCGGSMSEIREHKIKVGDEEKIRYYRHCYSCHFEF